MHSEELDPSWYGLTSQFGMNFGAAKVDVDEEEEEVGSTLSFFR
jgi:hypothetical protein